MSEPIFPEDAFSASDALADLEADFQGISDPADLVVIEEPPPPIGKSYAFDFASGAWISGGRGPLQTRELTTLLYWIEKCLRTARGAHPIHPPDYGLRDPTGLMGKLIEGAPFGEMEGRIREALTFHPRITDIEDFSFDFDPDDEWVSVNFTVLLDDDTSLPVDTAVPLTGSVI